MKKIILLSILSAFFVFQCTNEIPTAIYSEDVNLGRVSLIINKEDVPADVVIVEALLSRENHDTLYGNLNLISSTSADILIEDIPAGEWHLKVDAKDSSGVVLYSGETNINIHAGVLTQVNLTLIPTGQGTGSVYIVVNWGVPLVWTDFQFNPIISQSFVPYNPLAVTQPKVLFDDGVYKMWFNSVYNSAISDIWYAVSNDGINWQLGSNYAVLTQGNSNSWDSHRVGPGVVIKDENEYKMYYTGFSDPYGNWSIGLATSTDGINWIKHPQPVVLANLNEQQIVPDDIIKINNTYYLYYTNRQYPYYDIRLAISQDGINFTRYNQNPILFPENSWEGTGIYSASVVYEDNQYKMVFANVNSSGTGFGLAYSDDGIYWIKNSDNPFFTKENVNNNWCNRITYPFWRKFNNKYMIYYNGYNGYNHESKIGLVIK